MIESEAGSGAVIRRMLSDALLLVFDVEALAGVHSPVEIACGRAVVGLVGCHSEVPGGNFKPSFLSNELSVMITVGLCFGLGDVASMPDLGCQKEVPLGKVKPSFWA